LVAYLVFRKEQHALGRRGHHVVDERDEAVYVLLLVNQALDEGVYLAVEQRVELQREGVARRLGALQLEAVGRQPAAHPCRRVF